LLICSGINLPHTTHILNRSFPQPVRNSHIQQISQNAYRIMCPDMIIAIHKCRPELKERLHFLEPLLYPILIPIGTDKFFRTEPKLLRLSSFGDIILLRMYNLELLCKNTG